MVSPKQELANKIESIFMPYAFERRQEMIRTGGRFVHYTSAENALRIITLAEVWMRDARCMNDFSEINHGWRRLHDFFSQDANKSKFFSAVNSCVPGAGEDAIKLFDQWWIHIQSSTFITCMSEHAGGDEDTYGRLSMWRAYGPGVPGVALVIKLPLEEQIDDLAVFLSPVAYLRSFQNEMERVLNNIQANRDYLSTLPREDIVASLYMALVMAAVSSKHPGFIEEKEWRVIHMPRQFPAKPVVKSIETIRGVPQTVYKIPLKDDPTTGINGIGLPSLIDRVIIGPSAFPGPIAEAIINALTEAKVENAGSKVFISDIPIRA